jgi:hypothetical protein
MARDPTTNRQLAETAFRAISYKKGSISRTQHAGNPESPPWAVDSLADISYPDHPDIPIWRSFLATQDHYFQIENLFTILNKWEI